MKNQGQLALAQLILPSEILSNFEVVRVEEEASLIRIYLDESVKADYKENPLIESKRFCDAVTIRNFQGFRKKILEKDGEKEKQATPGLEESCLFYEFLTKSVKFDQLSTLNPLRSLTDFLNHSILESSITVFTSAVKSSFIVMYVLPYTHSKPFFFRSSFIS